MSDETPANLPPGAPPHTTQPAPTPDWAHSFGGVAEAYDRGRPTYPSDAVRWMLGEEPCHVLELGAGTGKLTSVMVALGHGVRATDPDPQMLAILEERLPDVSTSVGSAEDIDVPDRSVDAVIAAQSFHWFDLDRALPEIARVLRPGGRLCLVWNQRNEKIPWVRRLGALIGTQEQLRNPAEAMIFSERFGLVEEQEFSHWQTVDRKSIQDLVLSRSNVAVLDDEARAAKLAEVVALYDEYGRGMDGMQLPYVTRCFVATVLDRPRPATVESGQVDGEVDGEVDASGGRSRPDDPEDELLIDFR